MSCRASRGGRVTWGVTELTFRNSSTRVRVFQAGARNDSQWRWFFFLGRTAHLHIRHYGTVPANNGPPPCDISARSVRLLGPRSRDYCLPAASHCDNMCLGARPTQHRSPAVRPATPSFHVFTTNVFKDVAKTRGYGQISPGGSVLRSPPRLYTPVPSTGCGAGQREDA